MSKFVQKTLHSLNTVLNNSGMFYSEKDKLLSGRNLEISTFLSKIEKVESKHEEEQTIFEHFSRIEKRLSDPDVSSAEVEEMVKMCMVCEAIGYKADFIYVHSLKLAQKGNFQQKHSGYLAATFFLHPHHELVILLINTFQRDLISSNHCEVMLALTAVCNLINSETVHNVLHLVEDKLQHPMPSVRKCAVLTLAHCLELADSESAYQMAFPKLEKSLSDSELEVVSVVIPTLNKIIKKLPGDFSYLVDSLLQLLEQVLMRRIPHNLIYSDIPAPWLQIEILKLLKYICQTTQSSLKLAPVLKKILIQTGLYHTIAQAIVYQVIETIACIEADVELLEVAMLSVSLLLKSRDVNMKFMGLESLVLLMEKMEPNLTSSQQDIIIDCLKLPDETLQLKTLELMYHLANPSNVEAICKKMIEFLDQLLEKQRRKDLAMKILQLAEKYLIEKQWYISVVCAVLLKTDSLMSSSDVCPIIGVITKDDELKKIAKHDFVKLLQERGKVPPSMIKVLASVFSLPSEFASALPILETAEEEAAAWLLVSLMESILKFRSVPSQFLDSLKRLEERYKDSFLLLILLKQALSIVENSADVKELNPGAKVDPSLSCLDNYVLHSLQDGNDFYQPLSLRAASLSIGRSGADFATNSFCVLSSCETVSQNFENSSAFKSPDYSIFSSPSLSFQSLSLSESESSPLQKKTVWTQEGRSKAKEGITPAKEDEELLELFAGVT